MAFQALLRRAGESDIDWDVDSSWKDAARVSTEAASSARTVVLDTRPWRERFALTFWLLVLARLLQPFCFGVLRVDEELF
jgi:hypothetical protein